MNNPLGFLFSREETPTHVPNREILSYATGLAGQNISYSFISQRLTYYYENHAVSKDNASFVGKLMTATYVWDAVNDVLIGAFVDGRRHKPYKKMYPYLLYFPPLIGLLVALMFINAGHSDVFKLVYLGVCYFIWDFLYSFQDVGLWGLIALSSPHSAERARVAQWVSIGAGAGSTVGSAFPFLWDILEKGMGVREQTVFTLFAFVFGLGGELISMRAAKFRERVDTPAQKHENPLAAVAMVRHNPTLLLISLARFLKETYPRINNTYFFQSEYRGTAAKFLQGGTAEMLFGIFSNVPAAVCPFFAGKIIALLGGKKRLLVISQLFVIVTRLAGFGVGKIPAVRYNTLAGFFLMAAILAVSSIPTSLMDIAHRSLLSDSIDEVELKTGVRTEGVSFSMQNFTTKIAGGASTLIQNLFLYKVLGYVAYDDENYIAMQGEKFYRWQFPLFMLGPIVGAALYILAIGFIKDDPARRDEVERALHERREAAAKLPQ
ncbi:MAG: MFS transporter [Clostridia bacterium]|nr:MFS transporter [Clostridia bacterium]